MEEKLESGYQLYIGKDIETEKITGVYIRQRSGTTTQIHTQENELDFIRILPSIEEQIKDGYILVLGKFDKKFYGFFTDNTQNETRQYETYNQFFLNTLVNIEEKVKNIKNINKNIGGK